MFGILLTRLAAVAMILSVPGGQDKPHEWPPVKVGIWEVTITNPSGKTRRIEADENCQHPELIFWKRFFTGNINLGGCQFYSKKVSAMEYLFTGECGTQHNGLAVMQNHVTMLNESAFHDSVETKQQGKTMKWSMEGHWVKACAK